MVTLGFLCEFASVILVAFPVVFNATLTFLAWAKSTVVCCVCATGLTCRYVSSKSSIEEGMLCLTKKWLTKGEPGGGGPRLAVAGA